MAYCQDVRARRAAEERAAGIGEGAGRERTRYAAEEVDTRRAARVEPVPWIGWEAEAEAYAGERFVGHLATGQDGLDVTFADSPEQYRDGDIALGLGADGNAAGWAELDSPIDAQAITAGRAGGWQSELPTLGEGGATGALGLAQLPANTVPLVLGALYVLARAMGVGTSGPRRVGGGDVQGKAREMGRRL